MSEIDKLFADAMKALHTYAGRLMSSVSIERVLFNPPATVVFWDDGVKTVVKAQNGEPFDREKGVGHGHLQAPAWKPWQLFRRIQILVS